MKNCPWCGTENDSGASICRACGVTFPGENIRLRTPAQQVQEQECDYRRRLGTILVVILALVTLGMASAYLWKQHVRRQQTLRNDAEERRAVVEAQLDAVQANARARDHLARREYEAGLAVVERILNRVEVPELLETKFDLLNNSGRHHEAYLTLVKYLRHRRGNAGLHAVAGRGAFALNKPEQAVLHFKDAVACEPQNTDYSLELANALLKNAKRAEGLQILEQLVAEDPHCEDCWIQHAYAFANVGDWDGGINILSNAITRFPRNHSYHFQLAWLLDTKANQLKDREALKRAVHHYARSLQLHPMPNSVAAARILKITGKSVPAEMEGMRANEVSLEKRGETRYVQARINGVEGRFVLDTGASRITVYSNAASRFKLTPTSRKTEVVTANGRTQSPVAYGEVELGQQKLADAMILFMPDVQGETAHGLFGMEFLEKFGAQIDMVRSRLILRSSAEAVAFESPQNESRRGFSEQTPRIDEPAGSSSATLIVSNSAALSTASGKARTVSEVKARAAGAAKSEGGQPLFAAYNEQLAQRVNDAVNRFCQTEFGQSFLQTYGGPGEIRFRLRNHADGTIGDVRVVTEGIGAKAAEQLRTAVYATVDVPWTEAMRQAAPAAISQELTITVNLSWTKGARSAR